MIELYETAKRKTYKHRIMLGGMLLILCGIAFAYISIGKTTYDWNTIVKSLFGTEDSQASFIILELRLPRLLVGLFGGMALGVAGNAFQTMLRNPLASPDIIGVSSGTSVTAVLCFLVLRIGEPMVSILSVLSGIGVAAFIYFLSKGQSFSISRMILIGLGLQSMMSAMISFMLLRANQYDVPSAMRWLSGSLTGMRMESVAMLASITIVCITILIFIEKPLRIMELGEESSITLGVGTNKVRKINMLCAVILIAFTTSVCGPLAFISFLAGPIARHLVGAGAARTIATALVGASLVLISDLIGQSLFSVRFPVGVMTGLLGAPYLLFLLIRMNKTGGAL